MSVNERTLQCSPDDVFRVLADGWLYPAWVVAAARMRNVDAGWPSPGTRLHHSIGTWPLLINGTTSSLEWHPPHHFAVEARGGLIGTARVVLDVTPSSRGSLVRMTETAVRGPARVIPVLPDLLLWWRNTEALRRLGFLCEGMAGGAR